MTGLTGSTEHLIPAVREPLIMKVSGEQRESLLLILVMMIYGFHGTCRAWYLVSAIQMLIWFTRYARCMVPVVWSIQSGRPVWAGLTKITLSSHPPGYISGILSKIAGNGEIIS